jgi:hypothetical protein
MARDAASECASSCSKKRGQIISPPDPALPGSSRRASSPSPDRAAAPNQESHRHLALISAASRTSFRPDPADFCSSNLPWMVPSRAHLPGERRLAGIGASCAAAPPLVRGDCGSLAFLFLSRGLDAVVTCEDKVELGSGQLERRAASGPPMRCR